MQSLTSFESLARPFVFVLVFALLSLNTFASDHMIRLLVAGDPFAIALQNAQPELEARYGGNIEINIVGYNDMRTLALLNAQDAVSDYDIISFDVLWIGELFDAMALTSLNEYIMQAPELDTDDFLTAAYRASQYGDQQLGLPIQPHPELLWYRVDLFEQANIDPPRTTDDVLQAASQLHDPESELYGICWNAQRRQPLGQQIAHFYGAFGQPLFDDDGQPTLNTERGLAAAEYALALMAYSPPDILTMAWDQRILRFASGKCAMTYGWGARSYFVENDPSSEVAGLVGYLPAPHAPSAEPVTPIGTWSLGIPANLGERTPLAWDFLAWLSSSEIQTLLAGYGNGGMPRQSVITDETLTAAYPAFAVVSRLDQDSQLADWMRPPVAGWSDLEVILGTVFHNMLINQITPQQAIEEAQHQADN
ncbi:MAG: extracellular solute-binding protein [Anaerolineaceae bacterium]|nr:MAG: extracellular solute-binding protein [Anaerolineaceae bacterium]